MFISPNSRATRSIDISELTVREMSLSIAILAGFTFNMSKEQVPSFGRLPKEKTSSSLE